MVGNLATVVALACAMAVFHSESARAVDVSNEPEAPDALSQNPEVHIIYYDVRGTDVDEIYKAIQHSPARPRDADGQKADALTTTNYEWRWWKDGHGQCDPSRAVVTLKADVLLPRLVSGVSPDVAAKWKRYILNLRIHEAGHVLIAKMRFGDVMAAARSVKCAAISPGINAILDQIALLNLEYDKKTRHGELQGVALE